MDNIRYKPILNFPVSIKFNLTSTCLFVNIKKFPKNQKFKTFKLKKNGENIKMFMIFDQ